MFTYFKNQLLKMYNSKTPKTAKRKIRNDYLRTLMLHSWNHNRTKNCDFSVSLKTSWKWIKSKRTENKISKTQIPIF